MYGDQFGEFVSGYRDLISGLNIRLISVLQTAKPWGYTTSKGFKEGL